MNRTPAALLASLALLASAACGSEEEAEPYAPVADVPELMGHVIEPAAEVYWDAVGWILDEEGEHEIRPTTEEEWLAVENAAFVIAESGNLLMMEGRARDEAWVGMSQAMVDAGRRAIEAAEARAEQAVFDVGAEVYFTCVNCHATYAQETLNPSQRVEQERGELTGGADGTDQE